MVGPGTLFAIGLIAGLIIGRLFGSRKIGCWPLVAIPLAGIAYVGWWQEQNLGSLRSTSALEYFFVPIPPTFGALVGYACFWLYRDWRDRDDR